MFGKGMRRSPFQREKGFFRKKRGEWGNSVKEGFGKAFYRKGTSVKRSGPFSEPPDSENWKVAVLAPSRKSALIWFFFFLFLLNFQNSET